jgi:hypothetical protein
VIINIPDSQITLGYTMVRTDATVWLLGLGYWAGEMTIDLGVTV